ncbi:MAG: metallophosphoesterase family protein [Alkalibacterium sp.]|nr:metallophosphoesterase family protein [Alkalibacterium sp.]
MIDLAKSNDVKIVFYGHTHIPRVEKEEGIVFINPGSIAQPRDRAKGTYLVMELDEETGNAALDYYDQDHNKVPELSQQLSLTD